MSVAEMFDSRRRECQTQLDIAQGNLRMARKCKSANGWMLAMTLLSALINVFYIAADIAGHYPKHILYLHLVCLAGWIGSNVFVYRALRLWRESEHIQLGLVSSWQDSLDSLPSPEELEELS